MDAIRWERFLLINQSSLAPSPRLYTALRFVHSNDVRGQPREGPPPKPYTPLSASNHFSNANCCAQCKQ